jgi:hypothetical protein
MLPSITSMTLATDHSRYRFRFSVAVCKQLLCTVWLVQACTRPTSKAHCRLALMENGNPAVQCTDEIRMMITLVTCTRMVLALLTLERCEYSRYVHDGSHPRESAANILETTAVNLGAGASQSVTLPRDGCETICQPSHAWRSTFVNHT